MRAINTFALVLMFALPIFVSRAEGQEVAPMSEAGLYYQMLSSGDLHHRLFGKGFHYLGSTAGVWGFGYVQSGYHSFAAGPFLDIATFGEDGIVSLGLGAGVERFPEEESGEYSSHLRLAGSFLVENSVGKLDIYYENGETREGWLYIDLSRRLNEHWWVGVFHQTGDGSGPRVLYNSGVVSLWVAPMFNLESKVYPLIGGQIEFSR